jgi:two-component system, response regulator
MQTSIDVLIVDDCDSDAEITLLAIRRVDYGATTFRFKDGEQALQFIHSTGSFAGRPASLPRLIFLDVTVPVVNGLQVLGALRADPRTTSLPVVMLSSTANPLAIEQSLALGASDYIVKPVSFDEYCAEIERLMERWLGGSPGERAAAGEKHLARCESA